MTRRLLDRRCARRAGRGRSRWAGISSACMPLTASLGTWIAARCSRRRSCCGPAGRSSSAAWQSLVTRNLNMFTLIALGTGVGLALQRRRDLAPGIFPAGFRGHDGAVAVYFEAAAVITVLVLLGQVLELRARERPRGAIRALLDLAPKTARRVAADGSDEEVALDADRGRRSAAGAAGREGAGRRRRRRRPRRRRRIDGHRRADAGREGARRQA